MAVSFSIPKSMVPAKLPATWEEFEQLKADIRSAERRFWAAQPESVRREELEKQFSDNPPGLSREEIESMERL
jgi:hypothetical protein